MGCGGETCAILGDGTLECWGTDPASTGYVPPVVIGSGFSAVGLGSHRGCGVLGDGTVACWEFISGALEPVMGLHDAMAVGVGDELACALRAGGVVSCWGAGPLGDGTASGSTTPVDVVGLGGPAQQIAVGSWHACALLQDGTVACWGKEGYGNLGVAPLTGDSGLTPLPVVGLVAARRISAYSFQSCAVLADGTVRHWGTDFNPGIGSQTPQAVPGLASVVDVASGEFHDCALLANGRVACWGENYDGELGNGTFDSSEEPVTVTGLP
jgi:alpha-tubulin suppressor-like RCC1 family protein